MRSHQTWVNGKPIAQNEDCTVDDAGVAAFETMRSIGKKVPMLDKHHRRLVHSTQRLSLPCPSHMLFQREVMAAVHRWDGVGDAAVRWTQYASGDRLLELRPAPSPHSRLHCATRKWVPFSGWETSKHTHRQPWQRLVAAAGVDDVIMVDDENTVLEATCGSVLALKGDALLSPPEDGRILASTTIAMLSSFLPIVRRAPLLEDVDSLWLCSSLKLLAPVVTLDGAPVKHCSQTHERICQQLWQRLRQ